MTLLALLSCSGPLLPADDTESDSTVDTTPPVLDTDDTDPSQDSDDPPVDVDQREKNLNSRAGDHALYFLRDDTYDTLVVEIDWVTGNKPDDDAVDALEDAIKRLCDKVEVQILLDDEIPPQGSPTWTYEAAENLEITWRDHYHDPKNGVAALSFLYLDGNSEFDTDNGRILGYAYHGSSLIMFKETIEGAGSGLPLGASVEETTIVHELGHVLGLVNNGIDMVEPHQDEEHGKHDESRDCLMYWAVQTDAVVDLLLEGPLDFDANCLADIEAAKQ